MVEPSAARIVGPLEIEDIVEKYVGLGVIWLKQVESINQEVLHNFTGIVEDDRVLLRDRTYKINAL